MDLKKWNLILLMLLAVMFLFINGSVFFKSTLAPVCSGDIEAQGDFKIYKRAAEYYLQDNARLYNTPPEAGVGRFIYPPPSVLFFLPFAIIPKPADALIFLLGAAGACIASIFLLIKLIEESFNYSIPAKFKYLIYFLLLASAPFYQTLKVVQINTYVLLFCVLFFYFFKKEKYFLSSIFLSAGFWLKLYPIILLPLLLFSKNKKSAALGLACGLILIPLLMSPFIPADLYRHYFFELMPYLSRHDYTINPMNQSFINLIMQSGQPVENLSIWQIVDVPAWVSPVNILFSAALYTAVFIPLLKKNPNRDLIFFVSSMVIMPMVSLLGWEHAYILALPVLLVSLVYLRTQRGMPKFLLTTAMIMFLVPKPPNSLIARTCTHIPAFLQYLFYFRFFFTALGLLILFNYFSNRFSHENSITIGKP